MTRNINTTDGGGPWLIDVPELEPGETKEMRLRGMKYRGQKGYFKHWLPLDSAVVKNRDPDNSAIVTFNGQFDVFVEPNAADSFSDAGITSIKIENTGGTTIAENDLILQVSKEPYDADDAARSEANRSPVEKLARGVLGL